MSREGSQQSSIFAHRGLDDGAGRWNKQAQTPPPSPQQQQHWGKGSEGARPLRVGPLRVTSVFLPLVSATLQLITGYINVTVSCLKDPGGQFPLLWALTTDLECLRLWENLPGYYVGPEETDYPVKSPVSIRKHIILEYSSCPQPQQPR